MSISTFQQKIHMVHHPFPSFGSNHKSPIHPGLDRNFVGAQGSSCSTPGNRYRSHKSSPLLLKIKLRGINAWKMAYNHPTEVLCYRDSHQTSPLSNPQSLQSVNSANKKSKFKHAWQPSFTVSPPCLSLLQVFFVSQWKMGIRCTISPSALAPLHSWSSALRTSPNSWRP